MAAYLWIGLGGALGSMARHAIGAWSLAAFGPAFPWGTLIVNVAGSFVIGLIAALGAGPAGIFGDNVRLFLAAGVCGGFTTFSAFSLQTLALIETGAWPAAAGNVAGSVLLCLAGVWLGVQVVELARG